MILARSPYYITATGITEFVSKVILRIYVLNTSAGAAIASTPTYQITKHLSNNTEYLDFEISGLLRDKFKYTPPAIQNSGVYISALGNIQYLHYELDYIGDNGDRQGNEYVTDGYTEFLEGINYQPTNKILLTGDYFVVNSNGYFNVPLLNDGSKVIVNGNQIADLTPTQDVRKKVQNYWINIADFNTDFITVEYAGETITLEVRDECKFKPQDIVFLNRYGAWQIQTFFKSTKPSIAVTKTKFTNNVVQRGVLDTSKHTTQHFNKNGTERFKLSSGFLPESNNQTIKELLLSEHIYIIDKQNYRHVPINIETSSYNFKTRINDKLIDHDLSFSYANNLINNI